MLRNCADFGENGKIQANRLGLKKAESMVLCCLWTLYADRLRSGSLAQTIVISMTDLNFALERLISTFTGTYNAPPFSAELDSKFPLKLVFAKL